MGDLRVPPIAGKQQICHSAALRPATDGRTIMNESKEISRLAIMKRS